MVAGELWWPRNVMRLDFLGLSQFLTPLNHVHPPLPAPIGCASWIKITQALVGISLAGIRPNSDLLGKFMVSNLPRVTLPVSDRIHTQLAWTPEAVLLTKMLNLFMKCLASAVLETSLGHSALNHEAHWTRSQKIGLAVRRWPIIRLYSSLLFSVLWMKWG